MALSVCTFCCHVFLDVFAAGAFFKLLMKVTCNINSNVMLKCSLFFATRKDSRFCLHPDKDFVGSINPLPNRIVVVIHGQTVYIQNRMITHMCCLIYTVVF